MNPSRDSEKSFKVGFLARHGYTLSDTIGLGNYAKVKQARDRNHNRNVREIFLSLSLLSVFVCLSVCPVLPVPPCPSLFYPPSSLSRPSYLSPPSSLFLFLLSSSLLPPSFLPSFLPSFVAVFLDLVVLSSQA